jgi:uncharacterized protein DUF6982
VKIVAHLRDGSLLKGVTDALSQHPEGLLRDGPCSLPLQLKMRVNGSRKEVPLLLESLKALFFVKSFEGRTQYQEMKFFDSHPPVEGLWVRLKYYDGEASEGVVHNSLHHLTDPGFFLKPPDPESNNEYVYVLKASLTDFRVLGVRSAF